MSATRYFEDFTVGTRTAMGTHTVTQQEIIRFASAWDPQPFHTDVEAARRGPYGGLVAAGLHTGSLMMSLLIRYRLAEGPDEGFIISPGFEDLRWHEPVRPGDTLSLTVEVAELVPSRSKPDRGLIKNRWEATNQHGRLAFSMTGKAIYKRRNGGT